MNRYLIISVAIGTSLSASIAGASINIVNAHLVNEYIYDDAVHSPTVPTMPPGGATVILDSSSPGNTFSSVDARNVGFAANIDPATGGYLRLSDNATLNGIQFGIPDGYRAIASGTLEFVTDAPFSLSRGIPAGEATGQWTEGGITVTNESTGQSIRLGLTTINEPTLLGTLPATDAPAGTYRVDFSLSPYRNTGVSKPGTIELDLVTTPEPATLAALAVPSLLLRRRRR